MAGALEEMAAGLVSALTGGAREAMIDQPGVKRVGHGGGGPLGASGTGLRFVHGATVVGCQSSRSARFGRRS
jgi:hypothetical protein